MSNDTLYSTEIACKAADLAPTGVPHTGDGGHCAMCGRPLVAGILTTANETQKSFTDHSKLIPSSFICGWCNSARKQDALRAFQRCVITSEGTYSLGTDKARTWFWLTPPTPPYVVVINSNTTGAFHYLWQTPVTLDNRLIHANVDGANVQIRRSAVLKAMEWSSMLKGRLIDAGHKKGFNSPFKLLNRSCFRTSSSGHGQIKDSVLQLALKDEACRAAVEFLRSLRSAELWALSAMLKENPEPPLAPDLIRGSALFKAKSATAVE